jgi:hypothetical protein
MRVTDISLYSNEVEMVSFSTSVADPDAQYYVREMVGLDSEDLVPRFYGFGLQTKSRFYEFVLKPRLIVARFVLNPRFKLGESYSDVRDQLYKLISANRGGMVTMHFEAGGTTVSQIDGFITKFEVPYFTQLPEVQISMRCDDPLFRAINPVVYTPDELKTVNPIIVADSLSTAPHGFKLQLTFTVATPSFHIQDDPNTPEWIFQITPAGGFQPGDILNMSSEFATKQLSFTRGGVETYLVDKLSPQSIWPMIFPGSNTFYFPEIANFTWNEIEYYPAYWGV